MSARRGASTREAVTTEAVALACLGLLALASFDRVAIAAVTLGTVALVSTPPLERSGDPKVLRRGVAALALAMVALRFVATIGDAAGSFTLLISVPAAIGVGMIAWRTGDLTARLRWLSALTLMATVMAIGYTWIVGVERPQIDVLELHVAASEILERGGNPYAEARVSDTHPDAAPGDVIDGYPYPPSTMMAYATADWLFGDPRWASVVAVAAAVVLLAQPWARVSSDRAAAMLGVALLIVLMPDLGPIFRNGWTEPIAVPFVVAAGLLWQRRPLLAAALLGLAFGTKQYWIIAAPVVVLWADRRWQRASISGMVAAASMLPAFVLAPGATWRSLVTDVLALAPRTDSIGLAGIGWSVPLVLLLPACTGVAFWMTRRQSPCHFVLALAATLAVAFLLGSQAFINYWFLIAAMAAAAVVVSLRSPASDPAASRATGLTQH